MEDCEIGITTANRGPTPTVRKFEIEENHFRAGAKRLRVVEIVGLATVIVIVWGLLLLPVIFYHLPDVRALYVACSIFNMLNNFHNAFHAWYIVWSARMHP